MAGLHASGYSGMHAPRSVSRRRRRVGRPHAGTHARPPLSGPGPCPARLPAAAACETSRPPAPGPGSRGCGRAESWPGQAQRGTGRRWRQAGGSSGSSGVAAVAAASRNARRLIANGDRPDCTCCTRWRGGGLSTGARRATVSSTVQPCGPGALLMCDRGPRWRQQHLAIPSSMGASVPPVDGPAAPALQAPYSLVAMRIHLVKPHPIPPTRSRTCSAGVAHCRRCRRCHPVAAC